MLNSLRISNYALIEKLEISFEKGLTSITGETGAGKSIILGALSVLLGKRSDTSVLKNKERKSVIEAVFILEEAYFQRLCEENDIDFDSHTIIRREILPQGKSRAFVNDTPVNLNVLKLFGEKLIDIHSQHHNLFLKESDFQLQVVDSFASNEELLETYTEQYLYWKKAEKEYNAFLKSVQNVKDDISYYQFRLDELLSAQLKENEQDELEGELHMLENGEDVKRVLAEAEHVFENEEFSVLTLLKQLTQSFEKRAGISKDFASLNSRLQENYIELTDIAYEIARLNANFDFDPENLTRIQERLDVIYSLQHKFKCETVSELLVEQKRLEGLVTHVEDSGIHEQELKTAAETALHSLLKTAAEISSRRVKAAKSLEPKLISMLQNLGMPNVRFQIAFDLYKIPTETGIDSVQMLFSANKNIDLQWLGEISSGGEISRVMLCLKAILAKGKALQTIIFDEIDTGVSGEIADQMGNVMIDMANDMQVIVITHLPQIAAKSKKQFKVFKTETSTTTITEIKELNYSQRVEELAKMMSGKNVTDAAIANAKILLGTK